MRSFDPFSRVIEALTQSDRSQGPRSEALPARSGLPAGQKLPGELRAFRAKGKAPRQVWIHVLDGERRVPRKLGVSRWRRALIDHRRSRSVPVGRPTIRGQDDTQARHIPGRRSESLASTRGWASSTSDPPSCSRFKIGR